ncbi:hypothetical protein, partial [Streptomyces sp. NPDC051364]|uniref:hypothetical protein n=1 Tax=Streptomyces sp. NPDC051364 TaxID=3155799 RepID=UPI00341FD43E
HWRLLTEWGAVPKTLVWDNEAGVGRGRPTSESHRAEPTDGSTGTDSTPGSGPGEGRWARLRHAGGPWKPVRAQRAPEMLASGLGWGGERRSDGLRAALAPDVGTAAVRCGAHQIQRGAWRRW